MGLLHTAYETWFIRVNKRIHMWVHCISLLQQQLNACAGKISHLFGSNRYLAQLAAQGE